MATKQATELAAKVGGQPDTPPVRVLMVDDDEDDFLIASDFLREIKSTAYVIDWAQNPSNAYDRIARETYDICLLDYRLGGQDGLQVLGALRERGFAAPIVLLTGADDHEIDRQAMAAGASEYLVKGRIDATLLERTIRYAIDHKRSEETLRQQGEFVSAILNTAGALVVVMDKEGRIVRFNRACEQTTGYPFADVENRFFWEVVLPPEEIEPMQAVFRNLIAGHFPNRRENDWLTRDKRRRRITWSNTALTDANGVVEYVVSTGIDVTEQRVAERALREAREREVEVGASIQRTLLIRQPPKNIVGAEIGASFHPSQRIGGDYFDFFTLGQHRFDVLVGDVMGKGVPAALLAAATKSHFQRAMRRLLYALAPYERIPEPREILAAVHNDLTRELFRLESFVTLAYIRFDLARRTITFVECGHPHPIHIRVQTGETSELIGENVPLGMSERERYQQTRTTWEPGDVFFLYSDGLTEAANGDDEMFGDERLHQLLQSDMARKLHPQALTEFVCQAVREFAAGASLPDDLTCVAVRVGAVVVDPPLVTALIEVPCRWEATEIARQFVTNFCADEKLPRTFDDETLDGILLALSEALVNIIKYAYKEQSDAPIQINVEATAQYMRVTLRDWGEPFDADRVPPPDFDGSRDGGFGLYIIREVLDDVTYGRDDLGRNTLVLTKHYRV